MARQNAFSTTRLGLNSVTMELDESIVEDLLTFRLLACRPLST